MAKLIVKPTVNFLSTDTDAQLITDVGAIISALTGNPDYPNPSPTLTVVSDALRAFEVAVSEASLGGIVLTLTKNAQRAELVSLVRQLASYVAATCNGDLVRLLGSGFPIHKPTRNAIGHLPTPNTPVLRHGARSGDLHAKTKSVPGVFIYNWQLTPASAPEQTLPTKQSTGARITFSSLTPGQIYSLKVNAVGAAGPTDYSGPASLMVI
jgi:hypothetical protein